MVIDINPWLAGFLFVVTCYYTNAIVNAYNRKRNGDM